ncbi:MAG: hypothetical protein GY952_05970 [Rhodobacteraceae bacterium]|nr:hypothetical protein [Paracoccaceae bacterium]
MQKTDFKKTDREFYTGKVGRFDLIDIPPLPFLSIEGAGDPNRAPDYARAVAALYALSYRVKAHGKYQMEQDHVVGPLEGLWWAEDMQSFQRRDKDNWKWRMMIRQPGWLTGDLFGEVLETVVVKQNRKKDSATDEETLRRVAKTALEEGLCVQILHVGSYDDETPVLERLHLVYLPENGLRPSGVHHEIYLSDPRKVPPAKLKTILRQPVKRVSSG